MNQAGRRRSEEVVEGFNSLVDILWIQLIPGGREHCAVHRSALRNMAPHLLAITRGFFSLLIVRSPSALLQCTDRSPGVPSYLQTWFLVEAKEGLDLPYGSGFCTCFRVSVHLVFPITHLFFHRPVSCTTDTRVPLPHMSAAMFLVCHRCVQSSFFSPRILISSHSSSLSR